MPNPRQALTPGTRRSTSGRGGRRRLAGIAVAAIALLTLGAVVAVGGPRRVPWLVRQVAVRPSEAPDPSASRDERWRQDFAYLEDNLRRLHRNVFHTVSRERYRSAFEDAATRVPTATDPELVVETMRLVAMVGDAHTATWTWTTLFPSFPVAFEPVGDGWYVVAAAPSHADLLGARLLGVGDVPLDEAARRVAPLTSASSDADRERRLARLLGYGPVLHAVGLSDASDAARFRLRTLDGAEVRVTLDARVRTERPLRLDAALPLHLEPERAYAWTWLDDGDAVYLRYRRCTDAGAFEGMAGEILSRLDEHPDARLIVDLRGNGGGDSRVIRPLLDGLRARDAGGRTFALIDAGTFSSATMNAQDLRELGATLVGEPTGDALAGWGETRAFTLTNSGQRVQVSTYRFRGDDRPIAPDVLVRPSVEAWRDGRDPVVAAALRR